MNTRLIDVGPSQLAHTQTGRGPDLVFVHGWPLHGATFRDIVPILSASFTCHVLDLPGAGASRWTSRTRFTISAHAEAILVAIDKLGLSSVGFVAHDSGGAMARIAAARLRQRCWGLVSGNTELPNHLPPALRLLASLRHLPFGKSFLRRSLRSRTFLRSPLGFGGAFEDLRLLDGTFRDLFLTPLQTPSVLDGQWGMVRDFDWSSIERMEETHRQIEAEVAFLWGKDDPWFPLDTMRPMLRQFRAGATLHLLPGKLFVHEERPREFATLAQAFLQQAHARRAGARTTV